MVPEGRRKLKGGRLLPYCRQLREGQPAPINVHLQRSVLAFVRHFR
jgi:hypothetical protein